MGNMDHLEQWRSSSIKMAGPNRELGQFMGFLPRHGIGVQCVRSGRLTLSCFLQHACTDRRLHCTSIPQILRPSLQSSSLPSSHPLPIDLDLFTSSFFIRYSIHHASRHRTHSPAGHQRFVSLLPIRSPSTPLANLAVLLPVPVVQGGMMHVGTADLASAVSNAGGLGIITALIFQSPAALRDEIRRCRTLTKYPFAINMTLLPSMVPPDYGAYAQAIIDEGIKIVETAGNSPGPVIKKLKAAGIIILHKCTTIRHAQSAVKLGVDFLSIDGFECAGHVGESDITNFILLSRARQSLKVPFIASGGFADGWGLAAALCLGASGINMGTRFMCTQEAPIHIKIKEEIVKAQETDTTLLLRRWKNTTRLYKNKVTEEALKVERESTTGKFEEIAPLVSGKRGKEVFTTGDPDFGVSNPVFMESFIHLLLEYGQMLTMFFFIRFGRRVRSLV